MLSTRTRRKYKNLPSGQYYNKALGYVMVKDPRTGYLIPRSRLLAERRLGRRLGHDEMVHHVDENKLNDNLSNLRVVSRYQHNHYQHKHEQNWKGKNNPSYNMTRAHRNALKKAWEARKRKFGRTGASNPNRLRRLGAAAGMMKGK